MPRSSSLPLTNARSQPSCGARYQIAHRDIEPLGRSPVALETGPFFLSVAGWALVRRRQEFAIGPIGGSRKLHVV